MDKALVCSFVRRDEVEVISIRKSDDRRAVKLVAMSCLRFTVVDDRVEAEDENKWREWVALKDATFHRKLGRQFGGRDSNRQLRVEAFDV